MHVWLRMSPTGALCLGAAVGGGLDKTLSVGFAIDMHRIGRPPGFARLKLATQAIKSLAAFGPTRVHSQYTQ